LGFYDRHVLPHMISLSCGTRPICKQREKVVPLAEGRVLEVGMGSGLNLPYYDLDNVSHVWGLEPSEGMRLRAQKNLAHSRVDVEWLNLPGEEIPLDDDSADSVLLTFTLCTIPDYSAALAQMHRVLKPGGKLIFCEHGAAPDESVRRWQDRINPLWKKLAGGCNLNRPIPSCLERAGFAVQKLETMYLPGTPKIAGFNYWGFATHG